MSTRGLGDRGRRESPWARARFVIVVPAVVAFVTACSQETFVPPDPPEEIEEIHDINTYLFRNFATDEAGVLEPALATLVELLTEFDLEADYRERCFSPDRLTPEDVTDIEHPDRDMDSLLAVALVGSSAFTPAKNAEGVILEDQRPMEPASPELYERTFVDPADPSCFPGRGCDRLQTDNHILRDYLVLTLLYDMPKNFRWAEVGEPGSGEWAIFARSWVEQEYETDGGSIQLNQSYSMDLFLPRDGGATRYQVLWVEMFIEGCTDEFILETAAMGINEQFVYTEDFIGAL